MTIVSKVGNSNVLKTGIRKQQYLMLLVIFLLFKFEFSHSQSIPTNAFQLKDLIHSSWINNTSQKIKREEIKINRIDAHYNGATLKPQVKSYSRYHWFYDEQPQTIFTIENDLLFPGNGGPYILSTGYPNNLAMGLQLQQAVYDYRFFLRRKGRELLDNSEHYQLKLGEEELAYEVAKEFYKLNELELKKTVVEFSKRRLSKAINILKLQEQADMALKIDREKAELRLQKVEINLQRLDAGLQQKMSYLKLLAGLPFETELLIQQTASDTLPLLFENKFSDAQDLNSYKLLEQAQKSNILKIENTKASYLPTLNFIADVNWLSQSENLSFFDSGKLNHQGFLGLKLDIPIYSGGAFKHQKQKMVVENEINRLKQQQMRDGQILQHKRFTSELYLLYEEWEIQKKMQTLALFQLNHATSKFEKGLISIQLLFEAEEEWLNAGMEKNEILSKIKIAELELLKASGRLEILYQ